MLLLILFECLIGLLIWWGGITLAVADQPERRSRDALQRQRRAEWVRTELEERPWWWLMLSGLMLLVLVDWFLDRWEQPRWRVAILWTVLMGVVLLVLVALTEHFGWGVRPVRL